MKKIIFGLCLAFTADFASAQGLEKITVEKYYISDAADAAAAAAATTGYKLPVGSVTYRVYVDLAPGAKLIVVTGSPGHELRIKTTTEFYNNEFGSSAANDIRKTDLTKNTVMLDSWVSMGAASAVDFGVLKSDDTTGAVTNDDGVLKNADPAAGIPLTTADGLLATTAPNPPKVANVGFDFSIFGDGTTNGNAIESEGTWYVLGGATGPTKANRVLIGQFTTDGVFSFELNVDVEDADGVIESFVAKNPDFGQIEFSDCIYPQKSIAPTVIITSPVTGTVVKKSADVKIQATAADVDGTIAQVKFFYETQVGPEIIAVDSIAPYEADWAAPGVLGDYVLKAVAIDNSGVIGNSNYVKIKVADDVDVNNLQALNPVINLYPNPANDLLTIELATARQSTASYAVYDVTGQLVLHKKLGTVSGKLTERIDVSSFANGLYIVAVSTDGIITAKRIIKN